MRTYTSESGVPGAPEQVLDLLCEPDAIARWAPLDFQVLDLPTARLRTGGRAQVRVGWAGRWMTFNVSVRRADRDGLSLTAHGPIKLDAEYVITPADRGSSMRASVSVSGRGPIGRALAAAAEGVLRAGALSHAIQRMGQQLPQPAAF